MNHFNEYDDFIGLYAHSNQIKYLEGISKCISGKHLFGNTQKQPRTIHNYMSNKK